MKHSRFRKPMAFLLALMLCVTMVSPAFAARITLPGSSSSSSYSWRWDWNSILEKLFGKGDDNTTDTDTSEDINDPELTLIEDETTVTEGTQLRASTYAVSTASADDGITALARGDTNKDSPTLKYFPVTMYNYDERINNATHQVEVDNGLGNTWNGIYFNDGNPGEESYKVTGDTNVNTDALRYAHYNYWTGLLTAKNTIPSNDKKQKGYVYQGLVADEMENGQIKFKVPDGGIFDPTDTTKKSVYTKVGLPFVYNESTHYYTFDASQDSARFAEDPASGINLTWNNKPQYNKNNNNANTHYGFYPFNSEVKENTGYLELAQSADYHFGMAASIDFNMTTDGKLNDDDIKFSFAGDDDVWVFIDGKLVLDLGGIHDSVSAEINFAKNTYSITPTDPKTTKGGFTVDGSKADLSGNLFNADEVTGKLNTTLQTFAATTNHTLTIYYLERGQGASNCKIEFNLPQKDYISVTKAIDDYLYDNSGNIAQNTDGTKLTVSDELKESLRNRAYTYTLYCDNKAVAGAQYIIYNENGESTDTGYTGDDGTFQVKYGETVRIIQDNLDGKYKVVESGLTDAYITPGWTDSGHAATTYESAGSANALTSEIVTAKGSGESADYINFTCTNKLKYPVADIAEDVVVIDYGLPDAIDVLSNDTYTMAGYNLTLAGLGASEEKATGSTEQALTGTYGTAKIQNGKVVYTLSKQMTGIETIYYRVGLNGDADSEMGVGKLTIIPATTMYYEENFSNMVTFNNGKSANGWQAVGTAQTDPQEPGVVGTVGDSPYGSDVAYLNDSGDSNGSSKYVDTTDGAASFSYTFTGTGTSFFARTTSNSGYMRVVITNTDGKTVYTGYRDTSYKNTEGSIGGDINVTGGKLYNIPVFTYDAENYGTYTVTVTIAGGANAKNYGKEFWLDGIRVVKPLATSDANASVANSAYATDGEANMTVVTLRNKLITEAQLNKEDNTISWNEGDNFVLFTDTNGKLTSAEEYKSNGPKEEVYLNRGQSDHGQSVTFSLKNWDANTNKIYLGMKAPTGKGSVSINGNTLNINNATDCYYDISGYADITTDKDGVKTATFEVEATSSLISVTNIKVTGNAKFTIVNQTDKNVGGSDNEDKSDENMDVTVD